MIEYGIYTETGRLIERGLYDLDFADMVLIELQERFCSILTIQIIQE